MNGAVMDRVDATAASFFMAVLRRCALTGACLRKANLYGASLDEATLTFCDWQGRTSTRPFSRGRAMSPDEIVEVLSFGGTIFDKDLTGVDLSNRSLGGGKLIRCTLKGANLAGASGRNHVP